MKNLFFSCLFSGLILSIAPSAFAAPSSTPSTVQSEDTLNSGIVLFTPPNGWHFADPSVLPARVKVMVVGKGPSAFPPSMNLSMEPYKGTLKQYLKIIKSMNDAQGYEWKDLGTIRTEAGNASLSQVDTKSEWGTVRLMHAVLLKNGNIYILTASALKDEFSRFYKDFFAAMRSLRVVKNAFEMVVNPQQRNQLKSAAQKVQDQWQMTLAQKQKENPDVDLDRLKEQVFNSEAFQKNTWEPFKEMLNQKFVDMGPEWQSVLLQNLENDLFGFHISSSR
ncbi:hypothetical protein [Candidatus Protochlamydia phocaeensis]|uniref:hypothetical protein n=1 Tax=Candidatus Protochlamydia phocaeensis TaxID=1414722 RepID=UPI0008382F70|nr:hypothetical protein [Candidatus Protochlamydia phocaeensis]